MNLTSSLKKLKLVVYSFVILPHICIYLFFKRGRLFHEDLQAVFHYDSIVRFVRVMFEKKYLRNLFYYRAGYLFREMFAFLCPEDSSLHLMGCPHIGGKCHLEHTQNTFLNAKHIGESFYCLHNVTIENDLSKRRPWIGDNVKIYTGAVVVGNITVGDNSVIAANAVVRKDVPPNSLVAGVPAKVIKNI